MEEYYVAGVVLLHGPLCGVLHRNNNVPYTAPIVLKQKKSSRVSEIMLYVCK